MTFYVLKLFLKEGTLYTPFNSARFFFNPLSLLMWKEKSYAIKGFLRCHTESLLPYSKVFLKFLKKKQELLSGFAEMQKTAFWEAILCTVLLSSEMGCPDIHSSGFSTGQTLGVFWGPNPKVRIALPKCSNSRQKFMVPCLYHGTWGALISPLFFLQNASQSLITKYMYIRLLLLLSCSMLTCRYRAVQTG